MLKRKRMLSLLLAAGLLAGCATAEDTAASTAQESSSGAETAESAAEEAEAAAGEQSNYNETGYPIVKEPVSYEFMYCSNYLTDPNTESGFVKMMEEKTNVHMDWQIISSADKETKLNLMWASEDKPDCIANLLSSSEIIKYGKAGILLDLKPYMTEEYMPNFMKALESYPDLLTALDVDGAIYSLPVCEPKYWNTYEGCFINTEWLDNLGLSVPTTIDEFYDVLVAFRDNDCNGNGDPDDEIPFAYSITYASPLPGWFGTGNGVIFMDGKVVYSEATENYKEYVKFLNKLWENNLMDPEAFTMDGATFLAKSKEDVVTYGVAVGTAPSRFFTAENCEQYEILLPCDTGAETVGTTKSSYGDVYYDLTKGAIFADAQNPEILLRWFDTLYDPYYGWQVGKGDLGGILKEAEDGSFVYNEEIPEEYNDWTEWMNYTHPQQLPSLRDRSATADYFNCMGVRPEYIAVHEAVKDYYFYEVMPYSITTMEEQSVYDKYEVDLKKYTSEKFAAWVTGAADIDAEWEDYLNTLNTMGLEEYLTAKQAQYDRLQ